MALAGTSSVIAQTSSANRVTQTHALPMSCITYARASEKASPLLETIQDHPTSGAYNTLGVLYAERDKVACAIDCFEAALKLDKENWEAHYNLGLALITKGDRVGAERELQTAIEQKPDSVSSHFALGTLLQSESRLSGAEAQFRAALTTDPRFVPGALKLAEISIAEGKARAAVTSLEEAIKQAPADEQTKLQAALGLAYADSGDAERALSILKDLAASHPDSADAHLNLGVLYAEKMHPADMDSAAAQFREALRLDPSMDAARLALVHVLVALKEYSEAVPLALEYTKREPKDGQGFYALGLASRAVAKPGVAIEALQHAAALIPNEPEVRITLGTLLAGDGKTDAAIEQLRVAERINPSDPEVHKELASLLEKAGNQQQARAERAKLAKLKSADESQRVIAKLNQQASRSLSAGDAKAAVESYEKALRLDSGNAKLHYNLALALDRLSDLTSERRELEKSLQLDPGLAVAENQRGLVALRAGHFSEAEHDFKSALNIDPKLAEAHNSLGVLYSQHGKGKDAASEFQQAIETDPKFSKAHVNFGLLLAQNGNFPAAEQEFRTAIEVDPEYADAYAALGMLQAKTGHGSDAVQSFRKAVALQPESAQAHLNLGIALVDQFDRGEALREFSEAARLDPKLAAAHYNLGRFFFETGKYEDAGRELETALRLQAQYPDALYFLALAAKQQNQTERTTDLLEKLVALQPDNADAQYLLGQNLEHSGDVTEAIQHWKLAVQADPDHAQALFNLAKFLNKIHDPDAKQYQNRFDTLQKDRQITDRISELGNFALEAANAQNWPQAFQQMNEAIQLCGNCPQSAHLHKNLGLFYGRTGNLSEAQNELRTVLQLTPNDVDAQNALAAFQRAEQAQLK